MDWMDTHQIQDFDYLGIEKRNSETRDTRLGSEKD